MIASDLVTKASVVLVDSGATRWASSELLGWLNDARRAAAPLKPSLYATIQSVSLVAGARQTLPTGGVGLVAVQRNTSGPAITPTTRGTLDSFNPKWLSSSVSATIKNYAPDDSNPKVFWVSPPAKAGISVEVEYIPTPTDYNLGSTLTSLEEIASPAFLDYILYRAFSKDAEYAGSAARAVAHYQAFVGQLGGSNG
jgi:hypothetical protein